MLGNLTLFSGALLSIGMADINWMTGYGNLLGSYSRWTKLVHGHEEMLIPAELTVHIGLRQINITLQSTGEGMKFSYNEMVLLVPRLGQNKDQLLKALSLGLPNPILSIIEYFLDNKSSRTLEQIGYYSSYFLHAALVVWFVNQIIFLMVPELSAKISFLNAIVIALTVFFYAFKLESASFVIHVEGRRVNVTLGRSLYLVITSAFLQTIPVFLVLFGVYPRTSFEVDFGTPWDKAAIAEMSTRHRLQSTAASIKSNESDKSMTSNSTKCTNMSTSSKNEVLMNITPMNKPCDSKDSSATTPDRPVYEPRDKLPFTSPLTPIKCRKRNPADVECTGEDTSSHGKRSVGSLNKTMCLQKHIVTLKVSASEPGDQMMSNDMSQSQEKPEFNINPRQLVRHCSAYEVSPRRQPLQRRFSLSHIENEKSPTRNAKAHESLRVQALLKKPPCISAHHEATTDEAQLEVDSPREVRFGPLCLRSSVESVNEVNNGDERIKSSSCDDKSCSGEVLMSQQSQESCSQKEGKRNFSVGVKRLRFASISGSSLPEKDTPERPVPVRFRSASISTLALPNQTVGGIERDDSAGNSLKDFSLLSFKPKHTSKKSGDSVNPC
jgi:hypothetical protein